MLAVLPKALVYKDESLFILSEMLKFNESSPSWLVTKFSNKIRLAFCWKRSSSTPSTLASSKNTLVTVSTASKRDSSLIGKPVPELEILDCIK